MKTLFTFIFFVSGWSLTAQDCKVSAGTKTLYTPQQVTYTNVPAGYKPVFINYVGRHGARHLTKDLNSTLAYKLLVKADSVHALTEEGIKLKKMVELLRSIEAPSLKSISQRGKNELQSIAERMVKNNSSILNQPSLNINVQITKEVRTAQSADSFLKGLHDDVHTSAIRKRIDDTALRFYDLSPAYVAFEEKGEWKKELFNIRSAQDIKEAGLQKFPDQFFTKAFKMSAKDLEDFCKDIYGFASIIPSISFEVEQAGIHLSDLNFASLFTCKQLAALSKLDEAEDFLLKGPGRDTMGIQVMIAVPLLVQFINTSDEFTKKTTPSIELRFAHAETIAPFAALMQTVPASKGVYKTEDFNKSWKADQIVPLSANIQWIFYKNENTDDYLVKFLLNEKEVALKGLSTKMFPFYHWNDVRKFYTDLLGRLNVSLTDHMDVYLHNLK